MKAIETCYNGYRFRSRLEARWAVFFDAAGIDYRYEPEGFELTDGTRYLPDFFLPAIGIYAEVKGSHLIEADVKRLERFVYDLSDDYWNGDGDDEVHAAGVHKYHEAALILLGDLPDEGVNPSYPLRDRLQDYWSGAFFSMDVRWNGPGFSDDYEPDLVGLVPDGQPWTLLDAIDAPPRATGKDLGRRLKRAFAAARQARFEFGETPRVGASR